MCIQDPDKVIQWRKAIPAKQRIKEIEEDLKREFIETIQDSEETLSLISKVVSSATEEILIIFSHADKPAGRMYAVLDILKKRQLIVEEKVGAYVSSAKNKTNKFKR